MSLRIFGVFLLLGSLFAGCESDKPVKTPTPAPPKPAVEIVNYQVPAFSADSAYAHIAAQVNAGPRTPESSGHAATRNYITRTLERYGAKVTVQEFPAKLYDGRRVTGYNIIGSYNPEAERRIFLSAHYDTRHIADSDLEDRRPNDPIPGADDGASGVGVLLELARLLQNNDYGNLGVDLVFFDLEDYGKPDGETQEDMFTWALGSQHWARSPHEIGYTPKFGVLLDMVGAEGAVFGREQFSRQYAGAVQDKIWKLAHSMQQGDRFVNANIGFATDDHYFVNTIAGWPTVDIIYRPVDKSTPFGPHWHTHNDDLDIISTETLQSVGQVVTAVIFREAGNTL